MLLCAAAVSFAGAAGWQWLEARHEAAMSRSAWASYVFAVNAAVASCVTVEDFEEAAETMEFQSQRLATPVEDTLYEARHPLSLHVWIEPPTPLLKIDYKIFQFDDRGCLQKPRHWQ
ncbi:MAG: hypothetical protein AAFQ81_15680 [Pseudomonadota bacterium]